MSKIGLRKANCGVNVGVCLVTPIYTYTGYGNICYLILERNGSWCILHLLSVFYSLLKAFMKILKQNSTHQAIQQNGRIEIWTKGVKEEDFELKAEYLYSIPTNNKDDLFAIFERYNEDNRINVAEANEEFKYH